MEMLEYLFAKGGQVGWATRRDEVAVDNGLLIEKESPGVFQIVFDRGSASDFFAFEDFCGNRHPASMADETDQFFCCVELFKSSLI
jgi:hypothetical protein